MQHRFDPLIPMDSIFFHFSSAYRNGNKINEVDYVEI